MAKRKRKKEKKNTPEIDFYADSDDTFAFIAGYTDGGVPYGTTWEELGLEPYASPEKIEAAYDNMSGDQADNHEFEDFLIEEDYIAITDRLLMRYMEDNDFDDYLKVMQDTTPKAMQKGELKQYFIQGALESFHEQFQEDEMLVGIWMKESFDFCGYCILKNFQTSTPELGIDLRKKYRRKHIGYEALTELMSFARDLNEVDHIIYKVDVDNIASQGLAEKLGGVRKEMKNTLSDHAMELIKEVSPDSNETLFKHYEYWI